MTVTPNAPAAVPRDDRSWAPGAQGFSLAVVLACVGGTVPIAISAHADLELTRVLLAFLGVGVAEAVCLTWSALPWLRGASHGRLAATGQVLVMVVALGCFAGGGRMGGAGLLGYLAGSVRRQPGAGPLRPAQPPPGRGGRAGPPRTRGRRRARALPATPAAVGLRGWVARLRATLAREVVLVTAWVVATGSVSLVCAVATDGRGAGLLGALLVGGFLTLWAARRALGVLLAVRSFDAARPARRARPGWCCSTTPTRG